MTRIILILATFLGALCMKAAEIDGTWNAKLDVTPQVSLRLVLHVSNAGTEESSVTMDSPDQSAYGIPMTINYLSADSISVGVSQIMMNYNGSLQGDTIKGVFSQGGLSLPLNFVRGSDNAMNRPQTPQPPFPYMTEDVKFQGGGEDVVLAGTLTIPERMAPDSPVVILVSGSGVQNRDEEIFGHKPFAVIADMLAREGIPSLRYDDRGAFESTGNAATATTLDNAKDAGSAVKFLRDKNIFGKVGILGHSEGGSVAFILASEENGPDFIVTMGGPTVRGDSIIKFQNRHLLEKGGMPENVIDDYIRVLAEVLDYKIANPRVTISDEKWKEFCPDWESKFIYKELEGNLRRGFTDPNEWIDFMIAYDPKEDMERINMPVLMLYGAKDTQVPPELNVPLAKTYINGAKIKVFPDLNHLMQHADTGEVTEYMQIEETISPEVVETIIEFIKGL